MSIFINYAITVNIICQFFFITINVNKFNLRLMCILQFVFIFFIKIKIKFEKSQIVFDALFRLKSVAIIKNTFILKNLNDVKSIIVKSLMIMTIFQKK